MVDDGAGAQDRGAGGVDGEAPAGAADDREGPARDGQDLDGAGNGGGAGDQGDGNGGTGDQGDVPAGDVVAQAVNDTTVSNIPDRPDLTGSNGPLATEPTPGATYRDGITPEDIRSTLEQQAGYARYQWATGQGVVGPMGSERDSLYAGYNDPSDARFAQYQQFGYHHDLQAADAQMQNGWFYGVTNATSAARGMDVLMATGDVNRALEAAQREWRSSGFNVRGRY